MPVQQAPQRLQPPEGPPDPVAERGAVECDYANPDRRHRVPPWPSLLKSRRGQFCASCKPRSTRRTSCDCHGVSRPPAPDLPRLAGPSAASVIHDIGAVARGRPGRWPRRPCERLGRGWPVAERRVRPDRVVVPPPVQGFALDRSGPAPPAGYRRSPGPAARR
jgi:hypothetical protein